MATYSGGRDPLEELWKEILDIHWKFLETEESMNKIDLRRKLEGKLKEYISVVSHDRKFFLPETEHVLRKSITQMKDFSAFKASIGFESISQYANNLFTKPWRKEYRTIKMFSGFYQHEIKNNLMDAEQLFIAMGYTLMPNQMLILEGPICPDQVTNVSRDAMTAYVECQIMKSVNAELTTIGLTTSWIDIFNFREFHIGDSTQSLKGLAQILQPRHHNQQMMRKDPYALAIPPAPLPPSSHQQYQQQQQMCNSHCSVHPFIHNQSTNSYYQSPAPAYNQQLPPCSVHSFMQSTSPGGFYQHLPHSKSLDQYDGSGNGQLPSNGINHHRLSLDQNYKINHQHLSPSQQQPPPFDCMNHPYNQPNARAPLPYNLSSNLGHMTEQYYPTETIHNQFAPGRAAYGSDFYQQPPAAMIASQILTSANDYPPKPYDYSDASSPIHLDQELMGYISSGDGRLKPAEVKLRSSMKKSSRTPDTEVEQLELDLNELRLLKRGKKPVSLTTSDVKSREGIGNYKDWNYVFQNLKQDDPAKNMSLDDKLAAEIQLEKLQRTANGHGPPKLYPKSNGDAYRMTDTLKSSTLHPSSTPAQTSKHRTKSVSTATEIGSSSSNHHKHRSSSVMDTSRSNTLNDGQKLKPSQPPKIIVPPGQWSCYFCTFLNPDSKHICEMCSKSKDFFLDVDKSPAATTCV